MIETPSRHISWLGASLLALGTACVQADPLAFPASPARQGGRTGPNDPDYARAAVEYAVKPAGQGGVSAALVVKITRISRCTGCGMAQATSTPRQYQPPGRLVVVCDAPHGPVDGYRVAYEICRDWNRKAQWVALHCGVGSCGDPTGAEQYPANPVDWQTFVNKPWAHQRAELSAGKRRLSGRSAGHRQTQALIARRHPGSALALLKPPYGTAGTSGLPLAGMNM